MDDAEEEPDDNTGTGLPPAPAPAATGTSPTPTPEDLETASLRARYASNMDVVALIYKGWQEFGLLYAEWKREWVAIVDEAEKQKRALALLHRAMAFASAMAAVSYNKHKSWYVFLTVWVVPRQIAARGDLFPYSTAPIRREQRGARMKRIDHRAIVCYLTRTCMEGG